MAYIEVRQSGTGKLWFKLDPERCLIKIAARGIMETIDLTEYGLQYVGAECLPERPVAGSKKVPKM